MALRKIVQEIHVCDFDEEEVDLTHTIMVRNGTAATEMDLCPTHLEAFQKATKKFLDKGREKSLPGIGTVSLPAGVKPAAVRAWAKSNGHPVGETGGIKASVVQAFNEAVEAGDVDLADFR